MDFENLGNLKFSRDSAKSLRSLRFSLGWVVDPDERSV